MSRALPRPELPRAAASRGERLCDLLSVVVLALFTCVALFVFQDFGITWDERYHLEYGDHIRRFYLTGFRDATAVTFRIDYLYGGGFDLLGALFRRVARPLDDYDALHLMGALVGVLGVIGAWRLARLLGGPRAGLLATLILATTSVYFGHMFNNPKDLPFATGYIWGLYYVCALVHALPRIPRALAIKLALALGMAMSVRVGGLLVICYLGLAVGLWALHQGWIRGSVERGYQALVRVLPRLLLILAGAWAVMLVWWPWALLDPIRRPLAALRRMSEFIDHRRDMLFAGEEVSNLEPPWDYLIHYFGLKLPEYVVALALVGTGIGLYRLARWRARQASPAAFPRQLARFVLGVAIWLPPVYATLKDSPLYDGLRHFLFLVPPIAVLAALVLDEAFSRAARRVRSPAPRVALTVAVALLVSDQARAMKRLHPLEVVYFNRFIGGLAGAVTRYDTDYYGASYKELFDKLKVALWRLEPKRYLGAGYNVAGCAGRTRALHYLPGNFRWTQKRGSRFELQVGYTRGGCATRYATRAILATVEREGAVLSVARDMRRWERSDG